MQSLSMQSQRCVALSHASLVLVRDCWINGSTDFNFGQGSAVYDRCTLMAQPGQYWSFITAHAGNGTTEAGKRTAYLIQDSTLPYSPGERIGTTFLVRATNRKSRVCKRESERERAVCVGGILTFTMQQYLLLYTGGRIRHQY